MQQDRDDPELAIYRSAFPYFYNYLAGNSNKFSGVFSSALGQMSFSTTSRTA